MSYDLLVFEPSAAPDDRTAFISWFSQVMRLREGHLLSDPAPCSPALRLWYEGMTKAFPHIGNNSAERAELLANQVHADYRFAPNAIFARFEWHVSRKAYHLGMKLARLHGLGFFDASGDSAMCYTFVNGRFVLAHRAESMAV